MGRPEKPLAQKIADGTFRADRANLSVPQPSPFDPKNPFDQESDLIAWQCWEMIVPELMERYSVGLGDRLVVHQYCWYFQRAMRAAEEYGLKMTTMNDMGDEKVHPLLKVEDSSWDRVNAVGAKLGLNPVDRNKIRAQNGPLGVLAGSNGVLSLTDFERDRKKGPAQLDDGSDRRA